MLDALEAVKGQFGRDAARRTADLLERARDAKFRTPEDLIRLHEVALYLRAYPQSARVARLADAILFSFADRLGRVDLEAFQDPEISGIAGTHLSTNFSYDVAVRLAQRYPLHIDWENYAHADRLGPVLAKWIPLAGEYSSVEPHVDWKYWFDRARGSLKWLLEKIDRETYDLLEIPLRWDVADSAAARSRTRIPGREMYFHRGPFLRRSDISLEREFAAPKIPVTRVARPGAILNTILDTSAVRYRELWGFTYPDAAHVYHAAFGRGVDFYFFGVPREWRLPVRAYHAGMFFKNGVPIGYFEGLSLFERMEAGFNLYYTFREGETAWLYAQILKIFREHLGVTCYSIDPYQLGHENEEAIESGAFWFYRKLGFRSVSPEIQPLIHREEDRIAATPGYRTPPATLRRLAAAPMIYGSTDWDRFELRNLPLDTPAASGKDAPEEKTYLRRMQKDAKLRRWFIRRGSNRRSA
jgi:hypothetical protein